MNLFIKIQKYGWKCIAENPIFWNIFVKCSLLSAKIEMNLLFWKYSRIRYNLKVILKKIPNKNGNCHILGNGMSALSTVKYIDNEDCVVALNTGIFFPIHINVYMTELHNMNDANLKQGSLSLEDNINLSKKIYRYILNNNPQCLMIIKNMMRDNVSPKLYDNNNEFITLPDIVYKYFPIKNNYISFQKYIINYILNIENEIIIQTASSVITAITLAYKAGFKNIYIHGLDGGGSHYFHERSLAETLDTDALDILTYFKRIIPEVAADKKYESGSHSINILPFFIDALKELGIKLSHAENLSKEYK